jgi:FKBP-type peptidyl-prolyl cis-trans isomerase
MHKYTVLTVVALASATICGLSLAQSRGSLKAEPTTSGSFTSDATNGVKFNDMGRADLNMTVKDGDEVTLLYEGWLEDGTRFDYFVDQRLHRAFSFTVGAPTGAIAGMSIGVRGMKLGETRLLFIPSEQGYGAKGSMPTIPPNSNLIFKVTVVGIKRPEAPQMGPTPAATQPAEPSTQPAPVTQASVDVR